MTATDIVYSVVSLTNNTQRMGVIVDDQVYSLPINSKSDLLYTGLAPVAKKGYSYTILEDNISLNRENFTRPPVVTDTVNEHYNRSWNKWSLNKLPIAFSPLPIVHRIESNLHIDGQIPTIHLVGNKTELEIMHANQTTKDIKVPIKMTYIR